MHYSGPDPITPLPPARALTLFDLGAAAVCPGFAAITGHMWEDYFITFRASLNRAVGIGFVLLHTAATNECFPARSALFRDPEGMLQAIWSDPGMVLLRVAAPPP